MTPDNKLAPPRWLDAAKMTAPPVDTMTTVLVTRIRQDGPLKVGGKRYPWPKKAPTKLREGYFGCDTVRKNCGNHGNHYFETI
jgi:hypothetical protein